MSLSMGKLASSMKSLALEAVKATPFGDYLDNTPEEQAKMDQKYGSGALAEPVRLLLHLARGLLYPHCSVSKPSLLFDFA